MHRSGTPQNLAVFLVLAGVLGLASGAVARPGPAPGTLPPDPAALSRILAKAPGAPTTFALIVDLDSGAPVLDIGADRMAFPASVAKMFTTAGVLRDLPVDRRLITRLAWSTPRAMSKSKPRPAKTSARPAKPSAKAARSGKKVGAPGKSAGAPGKSAGAKTVDTLAIIGGGDPALRIKDFDRFAARVVAAGVVHVGTLLVDSTLFDDALPRGFAEKSTDATYRAPIDALQVAGSAITVVVKAGAQGKPAKVEVRPHSAAIVIDNKATTVAGRRERLQVRSSGKGRRTLVTVTGTIGARRRAVAVRRRVHNARAFAGHTFRARLEAKGVQVDKLVFAEAPAKGLTTLLVHKSAPLLELVSHCNKTSHNGYAETFFKLHGAERIGRPGTAAKAEAAMQQALAGLEIPWSAVRQGNGSGLYHANKVSPRALVALLRGMHGDARIGEVWRKSLAIGAVDGTLRGRFGGPATARRIFAKTGTLDDVTALAGYAMGEKRRYAFALFFNDVKGKPGPLRWVHGLLLAELLDPGAGLRDAVASKRPARRKARPARKQTSKGKKKRTR